MIDYDALKDLFGDNLPEPHIFFATKGVKDMGIGYARLRNELGMSSANTNHKIWKLFVAKYEKETEVTVIPVTGVTIAPKTATVAPGATVQLNSTVAPTNATNKTITYSTANAAVATVSSTGLVTVKPDATPAATVAITVKTADGNKTDISVITVGGDA